MDNAHFYGCNAWEWKSSPDLYEVLNWFKKQKDPYSVWLVPVADGEPYEIRMYAPQVEGSQLLGTWKKDKPYQSN